MSQIHHGFVEIIEWPRGRRYEDQRLRPQRATVSRFVRKRTNGTTCPSEIARVLAKEGCAAEAWRDYIWPVRCLMGLLTTQGRVGLSRKSVSLLGRSGHYKLGKSRT